jgi:hypothetical protein
MPRDAHQVFEDRVHAAARRHFGRFPGVFHFDLKDVAALGHGDLEAGERTLERMFKLVGPRSLHPDAVRELGGGSISAGRKVLDRFLSRLHGDRGADDADEPETEQHLIPQPDGNHGRYARGGAAKMTKEAAGYRDAIEDGQFCALCSMFAEPHSCSLVEGKISRTALCNHYEKA